MSADVVILVVVALVLAIALKSSIKHFKGEGACCGGGSGELPPEVKKLDGPVLGKMEFRISGMSCQHCVNRVTEAINKIAGAAAKVSLHKGKAEVSFDRTVDPKAIEEAVRAAGYEAELVKK